MINISNQFDRLSCIGALLAGSVLAGLSACAAGPQFERPQAPAVDRYTHDRTAALKAHAEIASQKIIFDQEPPAEWWQLFQSEELDRLIETAIVNNQTLIAAQAAVKQAQALTEASTGLRYPEVVLDASTGRQKYGKQFLGPLASPPPFSYFAVGPAVSYTLDYTGGAAKSIEQQQALREYRQWQLQAARLAVAGNVVIQVLEIASHQAQIATLEELLADDQRNVAMVQDAFDAGAVSRVDLLSAQSQQASDATLMPSLRQQLSTARHALAVLCGTIPAMLTVAEFHLATFTLPQELPVTLPSELVHSRPDILAAEAELHAATAAVGIAEANLYPRITLSASYSHQALDANELFNASNRAWGVISGLTAPLFDGGRLRAEKRAAVAALGIRAARYQQVVLESFGQVADALTAIQHGAEQLAAQSQALAVARENLDLTRESYSEGSVGVLQVLDSERLYQQARLGYVRAQAQRLKDTARLFAALGGGVVNATSAAE